MFEHKAIAISTTWGTSAIATIARIVVANPNLELSLLKQHAAAAGLTNETTVDRYAEVGPWESYGEGEALRLTYDPLGFGTDWEVNGANSGRTLPLCEGAFFVDGAFPRWIVFAKSWYGAKKTLVLDLPLTAAVHIATNSGRRIAIDACAGQDARFEAAVLACNARSAKLTLSGVAIPPGTTPRVAISIPLLQDIPLQLHLVPGCEDSKTIEEYLEFLLRESGSESNPAIGFAGLVGFIHPNLGLAPGIDVTDDPRGLALAWVRQRLKNRAEDNLLREAALKVSTALELTSVVQGDHEDLTLRDPDSPSVATSLGANRQITTVFKTDGSFPIGTWVSHVSGLVSGTVIASDDVNTTISNKSIKFSAKTRYFIDPSTAPSADATTPTNPAVVDNSEVPKSHQERKSWDLSVLGPVKKSDEDRAKPNKRRLNKPRLPIELQIAERAKKAHPQNRAAYLKMVFQELRRFYLPLLHLPLGEFYVKRALRRLRDAVCLTPTEAEAIWIALKKSTR